jgi:hypothetical protein
MATNVLGVFFWIWGIAGLLLNTVNYFALSGSVGVGTSTYVALGFLYWIAGMVLFGVGALMAKVPDLSNVRREVPYAPPPLPLQGAGDNPYAADSPQGSAWARGVADREKPAKPAQPEPAQPLHHWAKWK